MHNNWRNFHLCCLWVFLLCALCREMQMTGLCGFQAYSNEHNADVDDAFQFGVRFAEAPEEYDLAANFDWTQVNLSGKGNCGMTKCFFDTKTAVDGTTPMGYLVANQNKYVYMRKVSKLASWMTTELGAKHFYAEPAMLVNVTSAQIDHLNSLVYQPLREMTQMSTKNVYLPTDNSVVIQKVIKAPHPSVTFGRRKTKMGSLATVLPDFCPHVPDRDALAEQLARERPVIVQALHEIPALWRDWQGMVDVHGNFYFIDLDGAVSKRYLPDTKRLEYVENCIDLFDSFVQQLLDCVEDQAFLDEIKSTT